MPSKSMMHILIGLIAQIIFFIVGTPYTSAIELESFLRDGRLISLHLSESWTNAVTTCYGRGETLASIEDLKNLDSDIWEQRTLLDKELWTSNTYIYTPFITKIGCYQLEEEYPIAANLEEYGNASVAVCYAYCSGSKYFALLGFNCICNLSRDVTRKKSKNCGSYNSMDGKDILEVYEVATEETSGRNSEDVYFQVYECRFELNKPKATHKIVSKPEMSKHEPYYGACFSSKKEVVLLSNSFPDWESADLACRKFTGQPLASQLNDTQCKAFGEKNKDIYVKATIMTGKRTFRSQIFIADVIHSGAYGFVHCKTVNRTLPHNKTNFESPKEVQCNAGKKYFICTKDTGRTEQESNSNLIPKILIPAAFLLVLIVFIVILYRGAYVKCRDMKNTKGANQEKKGRSSFEESDPYLYNHTESSMRISVKKETYVDTSVSEDSGKDSSFSENCVESESQRLNDEVDATPTIFDSHRQDVCAVVLFLSDANGTIPQDNGYVS